MDPEPMKQFEDQFKAWASRPPATSAAEASGKVLKRLATQEETRPKPFMGWGLGAVAALGGVMAVGILSVVHLPRLEGPAGSEPGSTDPAAVVSELERAPIPEGVAVIWLDPNTPLYLTVDAPDIPEGGPTP